MSRWKAAGIHFSISVVIGLLSAALIFGVWYPPPYSHAAGADELVVLLLGVDCVLGPLLTLVVFKVGKKSLRFDLGVIALVQACAFVYGMSVVARARPAFIVAAVDRFVLVSANDLEADDLAKGRRPEFRHVPWTGPRLIAAELPADANEHNDLVTSGLAGKDIEKFPKYYVDYTAQQRVIVAHAKLLAELKRGTLDEREEIAEWLRTRNVAGDDVLWVPITARHADLTMMLDRNTGTILGALAIDPW